MKILVNKRFLKDLARVPPTHRRKIESFVFEQSELIPSLESAGIFEKLKGYQFYYRIRFGDYRVGVKCESNTITFERVLHRKEIYRFFP